MQKCYNYNMSARTNIQIPVSTNLKKAALLRAESLGFSSLQDVIRVFLTGFTKGSYTIGFVKEDSWENLQDDHISLLEKRFEETTHAEKKGDAFVSHSADDMMKIL